MSKTGLHQHWCSSFLWVLMIFLFYRAAVMGKGCIAATKYFLFLFNLLFFVSVHTPTPSFCLSRNSWVKWLPVISSGLQVYHEPMQVETESYYWECVFKMEPFGKSGRQCKYLCIKKFLTTDHKTLFA